MTIGYTDVIHSHNTQFLKTSVDPNEFDQLRNLDDNGENRGDDLSKTYTDPTEMYITNRLYTENASINHTHSISGSTGPTGTGTEIRPTNICVNYIIKAR